jgi:5-formyltetrahydrofolate cyclo-ligase
MRSLIAEIPAENLAAASTAICQTLLIHLREIDARATMLWMPLPSEIDLLPLGESLLRDGRRVCIPRMNWDSASMEPIAVTSLCEGYETRHHSIREPLDTLSLPLEALDAVLVPALAFDAQGNRLGRGGGYYDRFLPRLSPHTATIGVCLNAQRIDLIPTGSHDRPVNSVCCEREHTFS